MKPLTASPNLWNANRPDQFWICDPACASSLWDAAAEASLSHLAPLVPADMNELLHLTLGEGQFGPGHWTLSRARRLYYWIKPLLPRTLTRFLRRILQPRHARDFELGWPIEPRYPRFLFDTLKNLLLLSGRQSIEIAALWPEQKSFALVLTHDIESNQGQRFARRVMDLEEGLGFRSSFNFIPEKYRVDMELVDELIQRGFEVGVHGLKHDGKLFNSRDTFMRRAERINHHLKKMDAVGFRAPLTHRHPEWMQALKMEYDLSFFDTDPFEPIPGGTMSLWPFFLGHFVELPYTLVQDYTLTAVLGESTPRLWLEKVDFIEQYHGMALLNSHPDYLREPANMKIYAEFLTALQHRGGFWHALPRKAAAWWRKRRDGGTNFPTAQARLVGESLHV